MHALPDILQREAAQRLAISMGQQTVGGGAGHDMLRGSHGRRCDWRRTGTAAAPLGVQDPETRISCRWGWRLAGDHWRAKQGVERDRRVRRGSQRLGWRGGRRGCYSRDDAQGRPWACCEADGWMAVTSSGDPNATCVHQHLLQAGATSICTRASRTSLQERSLPGRGAERGRGQGLGEMKI